MKKDIIFNNIGCDEHSSLTPEMRRKAEEGHLMDKWLTLYILEMALQVVFLEVMSGMWGPRFLLILTMLMEMKTMALTFGPR
jgi:hypothetical protein